MIGGVEWSESSVTDGFSHLSLTDHCFSFIFRHSNFKASICILCREQQCKQELVEPCHVIVETSNNTIALLNKMASSAYLDVRNAIADEGSDARVEVK